MDAQEIIDYIQYYACKDEPHRLMTLEFAK